jgi:antitoxin MazE
MKTDLIRIGNSRGIRIPKPLIEQCGLGDEVDLRVENECLIISVKRAFRAGWEEKFRTAAPASKDELLEVANDFDRKEWRW